MQHDSICKNITNPKSLLQIAVITIKKLDKALFQ